ncbi:type 1 glutamine amidotransferase [Kosmotoga pacifica]|uniref:type 1 glutamine amidotransferase n=1 Tax=Kosmotoga pacifica TaxID=1330330 RepID=UPI00069C71E6|nr:gamma-glutamyl-gamma-aminobutyrate hydrolase family protein [Kosmotoga pacifica]
MKRVILLFLAIIVSVACFSLSKPIALLQNDSDYPNGGSPIENALKKLGVDYVVYRTFLGEFPERGSYSALIISGGNNMAAYFSNSGEPKKPTSLITDAEVPVLGICMGFQLIGRIYGSSLVVLEERGWRKLKIMKDDILLTGIPEEFFAWENHLFSLKDLPKGFELLVVNETGSIQMIKHKKEYIYGVQFHPEKGDNENFNHGYMVLLNFLTLVEHLDNQSTD